MIGIHRRVFFGLQRVLWRDPRKSRRPVTSYRTWVEQSKEMLHFRKPKRFNGENWGLGDIALEEYAMQ
jgi:hypothetical protein